MASLQLRSSNLNWTRKLLDRMSQEWRLRQVSKSNCGLVRPWPFTSWLPSWSFFVPFLRGPLMPICIENRLLRFQIILFTSLITDERTNERTDGRTDGRTCREHCASCQSRLAETYKVSNASVPMAPLNLRAHDQALSVSPWVWCTTFLGHSV